MPPCNLDHDADKLLCNERSSSAIIFASDVWGWNSGRIRFYADFFASRGYYCVVPRVLNQPCFEKGTDGDALPPDFDIPSRRDEFVDWVKKFPFAKYLEPKMESILGHIPARKVACMGFCWGAYFAVELAVMAVPFLSFWWVVS